MILNGVKVYNDTKSPVKVGDVVVFVKKYPALFNIGDKSIVTKVYVKETGEKMVDFVMIKDLETENHHLVNLRNVRKATFYENKDYEREQKLKQRAKNVGKS